MDTHTKAPFIFSKHFREIGVKLVEKLTLIFTIAITSRILVK